MAVFDFKAGRSLPVTGPEHLPELIEYFPFYMYHFKVGTVPNFVSTGESRA